MKVLLIHQNLPGQFRELVGPLIKAGFDVRGIAAHEKPLNIAIQCVRYTPEKPERAGIHALTAEVDDWIRRGTAVAEIIEHLHKENWTPDVALVHPGWGEALFLKDVIPSTPVLVWPELWLNEEHLGTVDRTGRHYLRSKNWLLEQAMLHSEWAILPTAYQASTFPERWRNKIKVIHEGVDESLLNRPRLKSLTLPSGVVLNEHTPVMTYISRNLEPLRGFGDIMQAIIKLHAKRRDIHTIIVGGDGSSYSGSHHEGKSWKDAVLDDIRSKYEDSLVHFVGYLPYEDLLKVLLRSDLNLYLSKSFVLSWSLIESIACGAPLLTYENKMMLELKEVCESNHEIAYSKEGDIDKLVNNICELIRAPSQRDRASNEVVPRELPKSWRKHESTELIMEIIREVGMRCF